MSGLLLGLLLPVLVVLVPVAVLLFLGIRLARVHRRLRDLEARVAGLEGAPPAPTPAEPGASAPVEPAPPAVEPAPGPPAAPPAVLEPSRPQPPPPAPAEDLEQRVGARWLNRAGALILVLGIGFFLKYAFDSDWIGPRGRVAIGLAAGAGLLALGHRLHRAASRGPAQGVIAAGLGTLYLTGYAAHAFYDLVGIPVAFGFLAVVTATGLALALRHEARAIAVLATLGGFVAPVVLSQNRDAGPALFAYLAVLDAGIVASAWWRGWRGLHLLSFVGTQVLYLAWFAGWYAPAKLALALGAATLFFALFAALPLLAAMRPAGDGPARAPSLVLALGVPLAFAAEARAILWPGHPDALAVLYLVLAGVYLGLGRWAAGVPAGGPRLAGLLRAVALGFLTLSLAVRWSGHVLPLAWSAEGLALVWGGFRVGSRWMRGGGLVVLALAVARWAQLVGDQPGTSGGFLVDSSLLAPTLVLAAACAIAARLYGREAPDAGGWEARARPLLVLAALGTLAGFLTAELAAYPPLRLRQGQLAALRTLVWVAATVPVLGLARGDRTRILLAAGTIGLAVLGVAAATTDVLAWRAMPPEGWRPALNLRFVSALLLAALYAWYAWMAPEWPLRSPATAGRLRALAAAAAFLFLLWHASVEVGLWPLLDRSPHEAAKLRNAGLSVLWTVYALAAMAIGLWRDVAALRRAAIALFALTVGKVLLVDLAGLDALYRIVSFVVLGAVLLLASFLYARLRRRGPA
jgi:uncharacterized membrane protein